MHLAKAPRRKGKKGQRSKSNETIFIEGGGSSINFSPFTMYVTRKKQKQQAEGGKRARRLGYQGEKKVRAKSEHSAGLFRRKSPLKLKQERK